MDAVRLEPWTSDDMWLLQRINEPSMTEFTGGPETEEKLARRFHRYVSAKTPETRMFKIVVADGRPAGSIGYWELDWRGSTIYETGQPEQALEMLRRAMLAPNEVQQGLVVFGHSEMVHALLALGRTAEASLELGVARKAYDEVGASRFGGDYWRAEGAFNAAAGRLDEARRAFEEARRLGERAGSLTERGLTEHQWGAYSAREGEHKEAAGHLERAAELFASGGLARRAGHVRTDLEKLKSG